MTTPTRSRWWAWLRVAAGVAVIAATVHIVGTTAFLTGARALNLPLAVAAIAITAGTTAASAWRWRVIVRSAGGELSIGAAIGACYRSQFLDAVLPGGVLGDIYRGLRRGQYARNLGRGLRSVFWDRVFGQAVQSVAAIGVLLILPSPVHAAMPAALGIGAMLAIVFGVLVRAAIRRAAGSRWRESVARARNELRGLHARAAVNIVIASLVAVGGYIALFALAAHAVGVILAPAHLVPLLMMALVASAVPFNVAGFGPREGVAAWAFAAAGLGADSGVAAALLYGILGLIAVAPGALLLARDGSNTLRRSRQP